MSSRCVFDIDFTCALERVPVKIKHGFLVKLKRLGRKTDQLIVMSSKI